MVQSDIAPATSLLQCIQSDLHIGLDPVQQHRLHCVLLVQQGCACKQVASWFGHSARTVERWMAGYRRKGAAALRDGRPTGRPSRVAGVPSASLAQALQGPPQACGYAERHWSGQLLRRYLVQAHGIALSVRQCQRLLLHPAACHTAAAPGLVSAPSLPDCPSR